VKSEERIVAMRDFMWDLADKFEKAGNAEAANEAAAFVGTLDWVLGDDLEVLDGEIVDEG
jgi:hypothetical protein